MTITHDLAALARAEVVELDHLRTLTLTNVAAGAGDLGSSRWLVEHLRGTGSGSPSGDAVSLAAQLHARTQDDFFPGGRSHVGAVTLAAALALADDAGDGLLECLAAGYRTMCSIARVYSADAQRRGYRPSGLFGPFGAAATAATALGLSEADTANAIGLAAVMTGGTNQAWLAGTDEWLLEVGFAARAGVEAALLTRAGVAAAPEAIEGAAGWSQAYFGDEHATRLTASLATDDQPSIREVAVKPQPVSGIAQVPTHLACAAHLALGGSRPRSVVVRMSEAEAGYPGSLNRGPFRSRGQALMSVVHCVACGLVDGSVRIGRLDAPDALATVADTVRIVPDPSLAETAAVVTVVTDDGEHEFAGDGRELLFPTAVDAADVARRSEAPLSLIEAAADELGRDRPDARVLRTLLTGSDRTLARSTT